MQARKFAHFLKHIDMLTRCQRDRVLALLLPAAQRDRTVELVEQAVTRQQLHEHLLPCLERDVLLVTDAHAAYKAFAHQTGISHEAVNLAAGIRARGAIHVQNVNAYHSRLRAWLLPFRGVASRYLDNYLGWRWALDGERIGTPENLLRAALGAFTS